MTAVEAGTVETTDPLALFATWLADAEATEINDPNAMALATITADGTPAVRIVLLKGFDARGFTFYSNMESRKGRELAERPEAALCFHWKSLRRQVRVEGAVEPVSAEEADAYFQSRARVSRLGAWASQQSRPLESRAVLEARVAEMTERFGDGEVPRPPHWQGRRVVPRLIEFWHDRPYRLHDRIVYRPLVIGDPSQGWMVERLYP